MAGIINTIADGIIGLVDEAVKLTDVILSNKGGDDNAEFVNFHGNGVGQNLSGVTEDPVAKYINEHFKNLTPEQAQQIYNTIKNGVSKARLLMEKCTKKDLQFRTIRLDSTREIKYGESDVMIDTGSEKFDKAKDIFKSASDLVYLGCVMLVKNLSPDNGNSLEISSCSVVPSGADMTDPENYDGEDNTVNIYNKDVYVRFIPSTSTLFYTKSISEIISQYMLSDNFIEKKDEILTRISEATGISKEDIKKGGDKIRCVSGISQLKEQGIDSFESLKQNSGGFNIEKKYAGPNVNLLNKYFKFKTSGDTKYQITLFEMFLTGKSINLNAQADLKTEKKYTISNLNEDEIHDIIEEVIDQEDFGKSDEIIIKQKVSKYGSIVVKNGKFIRGYDGKQLQKGEEIFEQKGEVFDL